MKGLGGLQKSLGTLQATLTKAREGGQLVDALCARIRIVRQVRTYLAPITPESLAELTDSIKKQGVVQPIVIRPLAGDPDYDYELVAGERRLRASMLAGRETIPAVVKHISDEDAKRLQRIENVQREALSDAQLLAAVKEDLAELGTARAVAERWHKSESWVSKILELDSLGEVTQRLVSEGLSGDREVLTTVNRIERQDPERAAKVVEKIARAAPTENVRAIVKEAVQKAKSGAAKGTPAPVSGNGTKGAQKPAPAPAKGGDKAARKAERNLSDVLTDIYYAIIEGGETVEGVLKRHKDTSKKIQAHLEGAWKEGRKAAEGGAVTQALLEGMLAGRFAPDNAECLALIAFMEGALEGAQGVPFDVAVVVGKVVLAR